VQQNFADAELDRMIDEALAMSDPAAQADAYAAINRLAVEKYVDVFLDQRTQTHVERSYVQGYYYSPLHSGSPNTGDYSVISKA
jgi:ABC-type transport system substrate-binding protein